MNNAQNGISVHLENHISYVFSHLLILHKITYSIIVKQIVIKKRKKRLILYNYFMKKLKTV